MLSFVITLIRIQVNRQVKFPKKYINITFLKLILFLVVVILNVEAVGAFY